MTTKTTSERILDIALDEFSMKGYDGTSMRQLAVRVGIKPASLYAHFAAKEAILDALLERAGPAVAGKQLGQLTERTPAPAPGELLAAFLDHLIESYSSTQARQFRSMLSRLSTEWAAEAEYLADVRDVLKDLAKIFGDWQAKGMMRRDWPPEHLAWEFMAPIGNLRTSFWILGADQQTVESGVALARQHLAYFRAINLIDN